MKKCKNLVKKVMSFMLLSALVIAMIQPVTSYSQEEDGSGTGNTQQGEAGSGAGNNPQEEAGSGIGDTTQGDTGSGTGNNPQDEAGSGTERQFDTNAPAIENFRLLEQGQTLKKGDTATLEIYAYDQESGIDEINVSACYEGGYYIDGDVSYNEEKKCYEWKHTLENISGDKLVIYSVTVTDKVGHSTSKSSFENGAYTVWADVEWQKPETTEVHITDFQLKQNGQRVNEADLLEMSLETDKISGVGVAFVIFRNLRGDEITICLRADESGKVFRNSEYSMGVYAEDGKWTLSSIYLIDLPENPVKLYTDQIRMEDYSFTLKKTPGTGETEEAGEAPEITQVELEKNGEVLNAGDQASITIYVSDKQEMEMSEIGSVRFWAVSNIREQWKTVDLIYNKDRGAYEGTLIIADDMYPCEWYVEDIYICNKSGNRADDSAYTSDRHYPYYILVKNGNTHVSPTFDFDVYFYVLDANGEWEIAQSIRKEGMERRQTMDEAGIVFPDVDAEYPGVTQIGWVDSDGNEITGDSQCISEFGPMMLYAKYDKKLINIQYRSVSEEGWMNSGSCKLLFPSDITFGELKTEIENTAAPEGSYQGIAFERWRLDSTDGFQEAAPLPDKPQLSFSASAVYDKNVLTVFYKGPVSNKEWRSLSKVIVYEKGRTYGELIDSAIENAPEVSIDGYQFEKWEYKLNGSRSGWLEETETDDSDNYMQIQCVSKFSGHAMILIRQCYSRDGNRDFRYPIYMAESGTKWNEVSKGIRNLEVPPEIQADKTFDGWIIDPGPEEDESGVKNGLEISMVAVYKPPFENDTTVTDRPDAPIVTPPIVDIPVIKLPETKPSDEPLTGEQPDQKEELPSGEQPDQKEELPSGEQTGKEDGLQPEDQQGQKSVLSEEKITQIVDIINNTETGKPIHVNMEEATVIPKEILEAAKGKDIGITLDMGGYSWEVNGMDIAAAHLKSIDLKVIMNTNNIPGKTIQAIAGENSIVRQLSLAHEGDFGFKAKLTVNVGNENVGKYGNLYYHDSEGKLVFIDTGKVSSSGKVSLTFSHASDYMIVMSEQQMSQADVPPELEPDAKPNGNQNPAGSDQDQTGSGNQNQTGDDQKQPGSGNQNPNGGGQEKPGSGNHNSAGSSQEQTGGTQNQPGTGSAGLSGSGNKKRTENEEKRSENNIQNENTAFQNQAETNNRNQAASNSQKEVQNRSVQTGDKTEGMLMILTSILSVGILAFMLKKKGRY